MSFLGNLGFINLGILVLIYLSFPLISDSDYAVVAEMLSVSLHKLEELPMLVCNMNRKVFVVVPFYYGLTFIFEIYLKVLIASFLARKLQ